MLQLMQLASTQLQNYPNYLGSRIGELVPFYPYTSFPQALA
jgi:hypothetical protein